MYSETLKSLSRILALACVACLPVAMAAQDTATPAKNAPAADYSASKWDIFAGYSYLAPKGTVDTLLPNGNTVGFNYRAIDTGAIFSVARYFNKYVGAEAIGDVHPGPNDDFNGGSAGLIFRYPNADMTPFVHGLVGGERIGGPHYQADTWGVALTAGGGLDYNTPWFNHHLAIRVFQADYQYMHANFGPVVFGGRANINAARLSAGLVYHIGSFAPPPPVTLACSASPTSVFPGDPVALTATAGMLNPKLNAIYTWSGDGVTGNGTTATVNTTSLAPGTYTVKCGVKEGKPGKEGLKPWESADSSASFTVKEFEPPTISCSSNPSTIKPGETSAITAMGMSPQNRPLTYSYSAASGTVEGTGATATFSSTGAPTGPVGITCKVADDKGHTVSADTSVTIVAPPPPPVPHVEALCTITFDTDTKRPTRVNNEAKACLDEVALDLQKQADAK
ncbi:MAG: PKD domain-containing protein, partial [Terracidiphilus sp.]